VLLGQKSIYDSLYLRPIYSSRPLLRGRNTRCSYNIQELGFIYFSVCIDQWNTYILTALSKTE